MQRARQPAGLNPRSGKLADGSLEGYDPDIFFHPLTRNNHVSHSNDTYRGQGFEFPEKANAHFKFNFIYRLVNVLRGTTPCTLLSAHFTKAPILHHILCCFCTRTLSLTPKTHFVLCSISPFQRSRIRHIASTRAAGAAY